MARLSGWRLLFVLFAVFLILSPAVMVRAQEDEDDEETPTGNAGSNGEASGIVATDEEKEEEEDEGIQLLPAPGVEIRAIFPSFFGKQTLIHAGQKTELLFSVINNGLSTLYFANASGNLYIPFDRRYVVQNFSSIAYNTSVPPGVQASFSYAFTPERLLQPRDFGLVFAAFYEVQGDLFASVIFNSTIEIVEPLGYVSGESIFLVMLAAGLLALFGVWAYGQVDKMNKKSRRTKKVETGTGDSEAEANEWLQGTFFEQQQKRNAVQQKRSKKKN
eukprot:TRINITY_DN6427_c0_g1_i1.p1 TRINITY_DN6427_c0_g1~~TRINITY_DN6427_c0_g1_i1.p1  ORF type:complete len:275 (+),score=37.34 TRINITY_DN6427_c0_g1_i1:97-921(+)